MQISLLSLGAAQILLTLWNNGVLINALAVPSNCGGGSLACRAEALDHPNVELGFFPFPPKGDIHTLNKRSGLPPPRPVTPKPAPDTNPLPGTGPEEPPPLIPADPNAPPKVPVVAPPRTPAAPLKSWEEPVPSEAEIATVVKVPRDKALLWSGTRSQRRDFEKHDGLVTDEHAYPDGYTWKYRDSATGNAYDADKDALFADRFSRVFAQNVEGEVFFFVPWKEGPRADGVLMMEEWPIVQQRMADGHVTKVTQVNPDDYNDRRPWDPSIYGLTKK